MTRLLKETTKELDLIDPAICTFVWRVCNNMLFEEIRCTDWKGSIHNNRWIKDEYLYQRFGNY